MQQLQPNSSFRHSLKRGSRIIVLVADNQASRLAFKLAKALLQPQDELQLVTVVAGEDSVPYGSGLLAPYLPSSEQQQQQQGPTISPVVLLKGMERLVDVISQYCQDSSADLLVSGSQNLCVDGTKDDPLPACGSFALRIVKKVRACPVLVVKANSKGPYIRATSAALGLKVMVECRSNSRHLLTWLMDQMEPEKDSIYLAVTKAQDEGTGRVKETATRMLTNFSVQAGTNDFYTAQRLFRDAGIKVLPQAVEADAIDILAVQAPDCKQLPDSLLDLLQTARTSLLVFNHKQDDGPGEAVGGALMTDPSAAAIAQAADFGG